MELPGQTLQRLNVQIPQARPGLGQPAQGGQKIFALRMAKPRPDQQVGDGLADRPQNGIGRRARGRELRIAGNVFRQKAQDVGVGKFHQSSSPP